MPVWLFAALSVAAFALAGCGDDEPAATGDAAAVATPAGATPAGTAAAPAATPAGIATPAAATAATPAGIATPAAAAPAGGFAATTAAPTPAVPTNPVVEAITLLEWFKVLLIAPAAIGDPRELEAIARPYCDGLATCRIVLWYDAASFPRELPVPGFKLRYQVFAFGRTIDGRENALWNCLTFPQFTAERLCLPQAMD